MLYLESGENANDIAPSIFLRKIADRRAVNALIPWSRTCDPSDISGASHAEDEKVDTPGLNNFAIFPRSLGGFEAHPGPMYMFRGDTCSGKKHFIEA